MKQILICIGGGAVQTVDLPGFEDEFQHYAVLYLDKLAAVGVDPQEYFDKTYARIAKENKDTALPSHWEDDPDHPVEDWRYEVGNNDTRLGYREWIQHRKEIESHEQTQ